MYIPNNDSQNYPFYSLQLVVEMFDLQLKEPTNQKSKKVSKVVEPADKKTSYKAIGTSVKKTPQCPLPPWL